MAWEDHPELVHAPGDGYDPRTDWRYDDTEHEGERNEGMGDAADDLVEWMSDPDRVRYRRTPRRPILPMEVAMASMAEAMTPPGAERFGSQPPIGSVLRWTAPGRYGNGMTLTYLAVRVGNGDWYSTESSRGRMGWPQLVHIIGDNPCSVATAWTEIPAPAPEPQGDDVVAAWASQFRETASQTGASENGNE